MKNINPEFKKKLKSIGAIWIIWIVLNITIRNIILIIKTWDDISIPITVTFLILLPDFIRALRKKIDKRKDN